MSNSNTRPVDRRSSRLLQSRGSDKISNIQNVSKNVDSNQEQDKAVYGIAGNEVQAKLGDEEEFISSKSEEEKDVLNQIENIPDNTQVVSPKLCNEAKNVKQTSKPEKKEYKKKQMKHGLTDREWLGSKENKEKWTALDAKRGMCNDCKKVFSSRQVCSKYLIARLKLDAF